MNADRDISRVTLNRPFPNYLWLVFQSESRYSSFHMKICFQSHASAKLNFKWKDKHLNSLWKRGQKVIGKWPIGGKPTFIIDIRCPLAHLTNTCDKKYSMLRSSNVVTLELMETHSDTVHPEVSNRWFTLWLNRHFVTFIRAFLAIILRLQILLKNLSISKIS